jgi:hypothetical protein
MKYYYILILVFLVNCTGNKGVIKTNEIPEWFLSPDKTTPFEVFGTGASVSKDESINIALTNAIGKIRTNVSSVVKTQATIVNNKTSEEMQTRIINEVEKFALSGYENTKLEYNPKTKFFYAEVKINKLKIYNQKLIEYENEIAEIETSLKNSNSSTVFQKLDFAKKLSRKAENLKKDAGILYALNNNFGYNQNLNKLTTFESYKANLLSSISFQVKNISEESIVKAINSALTNKKLRVGSGGKNLITINVLKMGETSQGKVYGLFFAKTRLAVSLKNANGETILEKTITYGATSTISEGEAYKESGKDLTVKFTELLDEIL